jgi:preprotein translocase subunit SecA
VLEGRRYSEGLHQAIEAKEGVTIKEENQTLATITLQNYYRTYDKLAGMTGTAKTEEVEFLEIYSSAWSRCRPIVRSCATTPDLIFKSEDAKFVAVAEEIARPGTKRAAGADRHNLGREVRAPGASAHPMGVPHEVLNAKNHAREAEIVAQAGRLGAVTVSTNMAGRGTDIILGGNAEEMAKKDVRALGSNATDERERCSARRSTVHAAMQGRRHQGQGARRALCARVLNATSHAGSTTSCGVVPAVKVTLVAAGSCCRCRTT